MAQLRVQLFGPLVARLGEASPPLRFPTKKIKLLLSYLLLHQETRHPRDRLASLLWGNREAQKARHCLNTALWRLRKTLECEKPPQIPFLIAEDDEVSFNPHSHYWLDVDEFQTLCATARQLSASDGEAVGPTLQRAVALYRDDLLPDCYDEWCLVERQRLHQLFLFALSRLAAFHTRRGEYFEGIACLQRFLACDPLREEVHRDLIRLYLAAARPQDALRQFEACRATLKRELGLDPMAETLALYRQLQSASSRGGEISPAVYPAPLIPELHEALKGLTAAAETMALAEKQLRHTLGQLNQLLERLKD